MMGKDKALIFEMSRPGRTAFALPECDVPEIGLTELFSKELLREQAPQLPEVSEVDVVRHFTELSRRNHGVDSGFYRLGSCTMKYSRQVVEDVAGLSGFEKVHPYQPAETVQGCLELLYKNR